MIQRGLPLFAAAFVGLLCTCSSYVTNLNTYCLYVMDRSKEQNTFPEFSFTAGDSLYKASQSRSVKIVVDCDNWAFRYASKEPLPLDVFALNRKKKQAYFKAHGIVDLGAMNRSGWQEVKSIEIPGNIPLKVSEIDCGTHGWGAKILNFAVDDTGSFPLRVVTESDTYSTVIHVSDSIVVDRICRNNHRTKRKYLLNPADWIRVVFGRKT